MDLNDLDTLYNQFNQANEQRKRNNFNAFMSSLTEGLVYDLDKYYASGDMVKYEQLVHNIKTKYMFRILRNSAGKHKLKVL